MASVNSWELGSIFECVRDKEPNEGVEDVLNFVFKNQTASRLSDFDLNIEFLLILIRSSIDAKTKTVNEAELRNRCKLMNKYVIRDYFQHYLRLLKRIAVMCHDEYALPVNKIDTIVDILQSENVITPFVRSHWFCAKTNGSGIAIQERCNAIDNCISFISIMKMTDEDIDVD